MTDINKPHEQIKTAAEFLYEYGINTMDMEDHFNCQLLAAMERYAESFASKFNEGGYSKYEIERKRNDELIKTSSIIARKLSKMTSLLIEAHNHGFSIGGSNLKWSVAKSFDEFRKQNNL